MPVQRIGGDFDVGVFTELDLYSYCTVSAFEVGLPPETIPLDRKVRLRLHFARSTLRASKWPKLQIG